MDGKTVLLLMGLGLCVGALRSCQQHSHCASSSCCVKDSSSGTGVCRQKRLAEPRGECGTSSSQCQTEADCPPDHCCLVPPLVRGRKRRQTQPGLCTPYGQAEDTCYASINVGPPAGQAYRCPCQSPLTCVSISVYEVPVGELGKCG